MTTVRGKVSRVEEYRARSGRIYWLVSVEGVNKPVAYTRKPSLNVGDTVTLECLDRDGPWLWPSRSRRKHMQTQTIADRLLEIAEELHRLAGECRAYAPRKEQHEEVAAT